MTGSGDPVVGGWGRWRQGLVETEGESGGGRLGSGGWGCGGRGGRR